ncbi:MAG: hypothetical protein V2I33_10280, partial [Kangiellaceae bacterium]|nr:hypothetical protein [Kangiellaceae bacterium]
FAIESGNEKDVQMELQSAIDLSNLSDFSNLLGGWRLELEFDLFDHIPFTLELYQDVANSTNQAEQN